MDQRIRRQLENQKIHKINILKKFCSFLPIQKKNLIQWYNIQSPYLSKFIPKAQQIYPIPQQNQCEWIQLLTNRIVSTYQRQTYNLIVSRKIPNSVFQHYQNQEKQKLTFGLIDNERIKYKSSLKCNRSIYFMVNERTGQIGQAIYSVIKNKQVMSAYSQISQGLVIKMQIIRSEGKVFWFVRNKQDQLWIQVAYVQEQILKDRNINFVPYVQFFNFSNRIRIQSENIQQIPLIDQSVNDIINQLSEEEDFQVRSNEGIFDNCEFSDSPEYQFNSD